MLHLKLLFATSQYRIATSPGEFRCCISQKNPRVRKIFVRNSGAGNGCVNFMDAWKNAFSLQEKPMSIKFLVLRGGGLFWVLGGGGSADLIFMGARIFLTTVGTGSGVVSLGESDSPKTQSSLESLENGWMLLSFPQSGDSLESLEFLTFLESLENGLF